MVSFQPSKMKRHLVSVKYIMLNENKLSVVWAGGRHARGVAKRTLCTAQMCRGCNTVVIVSSIRKTFWFEAIFWNHI